MRIMQGAAIECDSIQISVLVNRVEYKKHKTLRSSGIKMPFYIRSLLCYKIRRLSGLPGVQYIPVIVIGDKPALHRGTQLAPDIAVC
jgi:hypothetical protein